MPRAVICRELGTPDKMTIEDVPRAPLAPTQVRVAIHAAGVNFPDILMVAGEYQHKPPLPFTPGMEAAGVISELGPAARGFNIGDKVTIALRPGAYAEEAVVATEQLAPLPKGFSLTEGAGFRVAYTTASYALAHRAQLSPGEVLLVHGAGGGVGLAAVEVGKALGATVIATASRDDKLAVAREKGADHIIRYDREPFPDTVKRITNGRGADIVFDPVGGSVFEASQRCMAWGARLLIIGFTGGIGIARTNLILIKGASVLGVRAGEAGRHDPSLRESISAGLAKLAAEGRVRPHISHALPLERWTEAMQLLIDRKAIGRVVLLTRTPFSG
jgi:NADPH2:quinone reductase